MKKITIITAFVSVVAFVLSGCSKDSPSYHLGPVMNNYVRNYIKPVKLFLPDDVSKYQKEKVSIHTLDGVYVLPVFLCPFFNGSYNNYEGEVTYEMRNQFEYENLIHNIGNYEYNDDRYPPIKEHLLRYDSLCKAHKDTEYSKKEKHYSGQQFFMATYRRMTLDITSDAPYDAAHPAGTSLADIIDVCTFSAKEMIDSGYDYRSVGVKDEGGAYIISLGHKLDMPLTQFNQEYRKLIDYVMYLDFKTAPDVTSTHRFTVTYRDEDGRVLTATAAPVTLQGKGAE